MRGDDVELTFHQDGVAFLGDFVSRQVEAEDHSSFYIGGGFGGVDVLALLVGAHGPGGEGERLAALIPDGYDQAFREEVSPVAAHQSSLLGVLEGFLLCSQVLREASARGGVAELEAAGGRFADQP